MGKQGDVIRLYSTQRKNVVDLIHKNGTCFSRKEFIQKKYGESAPIFLAAYTWLAREAPRFVPKPTGAQLHYWAFAEESSFERYDDSCVLVLDVPVQAGVYFSLFDWNTILKLQYLGKAPEDTARFQARLRECGVRRESDVILTHFYPDLKREMEESWQHLFRHHHQIAAGNAPFSAVQAALWEIRLDWIRDIVG